MAHKGISKYTSAKNNEKYRPDCVVSVDHCLVQSTIESLEYNRVATRRTRGGFGKLFREVGLPQDHFRQEHQPIR